MKALAIVGFIHEDCYHVKAVKISSASTFREAEAKQSKWWSDVNSGAIKKHGITDTGICNNFEGDEIDAQQIQLYEN